MTTQRIGRIVAGFLLAAMLVAGWVSVDRHWVASAVTSVDDQLNSADLAKVRALSIQLEPRLQDETDHLKIALLLRNLIHQKVTAKWYTPARLDGYNWLDLDASYRKTLLDPEYTHACGGMAIEYMIALRSFGITSRKVGMYPSVVDVPDIANSHASVDVLIDGKWIASDPNFNMTLIDDAGRRIGWTEAADRLRLGKTVAASYDGFPVNPRYTLESYVDKTKTSLQEMTNFMNASPYWDGMRSVAALKLPESWDGSLRYSNGKTINVFANDALSVYAVLSMPVQRTDSAKP